MNSGLFSALSGNSVSQCNAGNSALLQVNDSFDINVVASATTNFAKNDIISRGILIAEQDVDNVTINSALSAQNAGTSSIFATPVNNISILIYNQDPTAPTTTTTQPGASTTTTTTKVTQTPSSNEKTTGSKAGSTTPKTKVINKSTIVTLNQAKNGGIANSDSYAGLPQVKALLKGIQDTTVKKSQAIGTIKTKDNNSFSLLWLMILVAIILTIISIKQAQQNARNKKLIEETDY